MTTLPSEKVPARWWQWWPLLLGPVGMIVAYQLSGTGPWHYYNKPALEQIAIAVTVPGVALAAVHLYVSRERYHLLLLALTLTVLFREFHWRWTTKFVYVSVVALAAVAVIWRRHVFTYVDDQPVVRRWLVATAITYVLSQAIARRAFRGVIPNEAAVYNDMEELIEVVAHAMLVVTTLVGPWSRATPPTIED